MEEATPLLSSSAIPSNGPNFSPSSSTAALTRLSSTVYLLQGTTSPKPDAPSAILLFAWMGAPVRHMSKFVDYYTQTVFPGSPIILVLCTTKFFLTSQREQRKSLGPAITAYLSLHANPDRVLVHTFSNGGIASLRTFTQVLPAGEVFNPKVLIVDSAPGVTEMKSGLAAMTADIRSPFWKFIASIFFRFFFWYYKFKAWVLRQDYVLEGLRKWLLDEEKGIGKETKRLYIYSNNDALTSKEAVETHLADVKTKGLDSRSVNFGETKHVGHMRANPDLYWEEVMKVWKE